MSRFLFVVPPLTGHVNPTVSVAASLAGRGHEVAWVGHPGAVRPRLPAGATLYELDDRVPRPLMEKMTARANTVRGLASLKFLWEDFLVPLARAMRPGVEAVVDAFAPDALIVDHQTLAGTLVARRRGLPWASFVTTSASITDPLAGLPKVQAWLDQQVRTLEAEAGLDPAPGSPDLSPHLVVVFSTEALVGAGPWPGHYAFVGPAFADRPQVDFPWDALADGPKVLVSLGTVNFERGRRFFAAACEALGSLPVQGILVAPADRCPELPPNVIRRDFVPQVALLDHVDAVVTHAGHNTVCEALAHGLPLVVAPVKDDQPVVAGQVVAAGAGVRLQLRAYHRGPARRSPSAPSSRTAPTGRRRGASRRASRVPGAPTRPRPASRPSPGRRGAGAGPSAAVNGRGRKGRVPHEVGRAGAHAPLGRGRPPAPGPPGAPPGPHRRRRHAGPRPR